MAWASSEASDGWDLSGWVANGPAKWVAILLPNAALRGRLKSFLDVVIQFSAAELAASDDNTRTLATANGQPYGSHSVIAPTALGPPRPTATRRVLSCIRGEQQ